MKKSYSGNDIEKALSEVRKTDGLTARAAARKYGLASSTLHDHLHGTVKKVGAGGPTVLTMSEEREISMTCVALAEIGFGITRALVEIVIFDYLKDNGNENPFHGGVPGKDWWQRFKRRWPMISERKPQHLSLKRAQAGNEEILRAWFDKVKEALSKNRLQIDDEAISTRLWNCDETAFCTSVSSQKLLARRGMRTVHEIGGESGRQYITVHCAGNAHGERLPPFILYKGKNMYQRWMQGGPAGAVYGISESGWMDASNFLSWFCKLFLPAVAHLTKTAPVVLFFDGHYSHISMELINQARANKVVLMCFPPNTTHLLQPLDVGVFAPLKNAWRAILKQYKLETRGEHASKEVFPSLIAKLWETSFMPKHCIGGFRSAGLTPFSPEHVLQKLMPMTAPALELEPEQDKQIDKVNPVNPPKQRTTKVTCTSCGNEMMPTTPTEKMCITSYFAGILEIQKHKPKVGERNNLKIRLEGEVLTTDEFIELLEEEKSTKEKGKSKGKAKKCHGEEQVAGMCY